jgi:small subunit ribosomal protein S2
MAVVTMRQLLESGVHFGHQTRRWNPKMKRFIMTERNGIYIIDLQQSLAYIDRSYAFIKDTVAKGGTVMFVGTKKQAQEAIAEQAIRVGMPYVNQRWLGGMLTNFQTVHQRINRLKELDEIDFEDVAGSSRTKKELLQMRRERDKLNKSLGGIREMSRTPSAVWIVDTNKEHLAVEEARKLHIPIIGILDSNCDPDLVDFPIPGNDDAIRAVGLLTRVVADAVAEGLIARSGAKTDGAEAGAEEPLAEWERELLGGDAEQAAAAATGDATAEAPAAESTGATAEAADATEVAAEATDAPAAEASEAPAAEVTDAPAAEVTDAPAAEVTDAPGAEVAEVTTEVETTSPAEVESEVTVSTDEASPPDATAEATPLSEPVGEQVADEFGPDSAAPLEDGAAPEGFEIKGNKNSMKFHAPSSPWYARTNAEVWFRTAEAAEAAGFANAESGDTTEATDTTEA